MKSEQLEIYEAHIKNIEEESERFRKQKKRQRLREDLIDCAQGLAVVMPDFIVKAFIFISIVHFVFKFW